MFEQDTFARTLVSLTSLRLRVVSHTKERIISTFEKRRKEKKGRERRRNEQIGEETNIKENKGVERSRKEYPIKATPYSQCSHLNLLTNWKV